MSGDRYGLICLTCNDAMDLATTCVTQHDLDDGEDLGPGWSRFLGRHAGHLLSLVPEARVREVWEATRAREAQTPDEMLAEVRAHLHDPIPEPQVLWQTDDYTRPAWLLISADLMREAFRPDQDMYRIPVARIDIFQGRSITLMQGAAYDQHGILALVDNEANRDGVGGMLANVKLVPDEPTPCTDCRNGHCDAGYGNRLGGPGTCPDYRPPLSASEALREAGEAIERGETVCLDASRVPEEDKARVVADALTALMPPTDEEPAP